MMDTVSGSNNLTGLSPISSRLQHEMHMSESMLLDCFAGMAMQAIESNPAKDYEPADLAQRSYLIARAMLAERSKT